jgi:enolase
MHASSPLLFESIYIIPKHTISYSEQIKNCAEVCDTLRRRLHGDSPCFPVGKGGGLVANSPIIATIIAQIEKVISDSGFSPGSDFSIGIDCAASSFYDPEKQKYQVEKGVVKSSAELVQYYIDLMIQYPSINYINDGISEVDHAGWEMMREGLMNRVKVFGGDVYATQSIFARRGLKKNWTDGIMVQPGQAGTLSDSVETARLFKQRGSLISVGRRSGETCDTLIADFAVAMQSSYFIGGGLFGAEGTAKYNQMLRIYEYLRDRSMLQQ